MRSAGASLAAILACAALLPGCGGLWRWPWGNTQRWPGPMEPLANPLPPGDRELFQEGPEEMLVLRHADPCQVRPAGYASSFPLSFYRKSLRLHSGSRVYTAPGGRLEVLWPNGSSITLYGRGAGIIGSKSRGEPAFVFQQVERAQIDLVEADEIDLVGGARLSAKSGPFEVQLMTADLMRVKNQSKEPGDVAYRSAVFHLDPGQIVDLPLGTTPGAPLPEAGDWQGAQVRGLDVEWQGGLQRLDSDEEVGLRANGDNEIRALGLRVRLERDEEVRFRPLGNQPEPR
ncbi:MAG: hypothetical protein IPJ19_13220 [Planctomycetes bacterium]|nr:hypothetical protein [Planctomycetota bacterium]